jgi:AAA domain
VSTQPPWDEYEGSTKGNGFDPPRESQEALALKPFLEYLQPGPVPEFIVDGLLEARSVVGLVAPPEAGKSLLMQEISLCVALGVPFHGRKTSRGSVLYLVGEGQHGLRARFQALSSRYGEQLDGELVPFECSTSAVPLTDPSEQLKIQESIRGLNEEYELPVKLIVVDTLSRFIAPLDESKASDMGLYLTAIENIRGDATVVSLHHPGHGDATRGRGSSSWKAGLDAEYSIAKAEDTITISCQKMKDGVKPEPFSFRIISAPTSLTRPDGTPVTSALLQSTHYQPARKPLTGTAKRKLLAALEAITTGPGVWQEGEIREIGRRAGLHRNSARDAAVSLHELGYLIRTIGGSRLRRLDE